MKIRPMREEDLEFCVDRFREEGWLGETAEVLRGFLSYDPGGCLIGEEDGRQVGMCVGVSYGECGFLGELIVVKDRRGRGFGRRLLEHCIAYLGTRGCRSIYLDGDDPAVRLYEKLGFRHVCRSLRFCGRVPGRTHDQVRPMTAGDMESVARIDRAAFGADRRFFLERRLRWFPDLCKVLHSGGRILGYCMAQPGLGVVSIGPWWVGEGVERPVDLLEGIAAGAGGRELRLGVLESNSRAVGVIRGLKGWTETGPSWRMVLGPDVGLGSSESLFSIGTASKG